MGEEPPHADPLLRVRRVVSRDEGSTVPLRGRWKCVRLLAAACAAASMGGSASALGDKPYSFHGKHVFVTGGTNGIGLCIAKLLLSRGASVSLIDIADPTAALQQLEDCTKTESLPGKIFFTKANVGDYQQVSFDPQNQAFCICRGAFQR